MALDANQLFSNAQVITASGWSTNAVQVGKTPTDGLEIEVNITAASGTTPTIDIVAYERAADSGWATTDPKCGVLKQMTTTGRLYFRVMSKLQFVKLYATVAGTTPSFTVTAGPCTGGQRDMVA